MYSTKLSVRFNSSNCQVRVGNLCSTFFFNVQRFFFDSISNAAAFISIGLSDQTSRI